MVEAYANDSDPGEATTTNIADVITANAPT